MWNKIKEFFSGFVRPFTSLESRTASIGLFASLFLIIAIASGTGLIGLAGVYGSLAPKESASSSSDSSSDTQKSDEKCNVVGIEIRGCIMTYTPDNPSSYTGPGDITCYDITSS